MPAAAPTSPLSQFHRQLIETFDLDEIKQLCFDLTIHYDELSGDRLSSKARELIVYCASHSKLQSLFDVVRRQRPHIEWTTIFDASDVPTWADADKRAYAALHQLRPIPEHFLGRDEELAALCAAIRVGAKIGRPSAITSSIQGLGGVGKTALAMAAAHQLSVDFPDAQLVIELRANGSHPVEPARALEDALRAFYPPDQRLPEDPAQLRNLYLAALQGKRTLVILDDARDDAHVQLLLPPAGCAALITSRRSLGIGQPLRLGALKPTDAATLLRQLCPRLSEPEADELAAACAHLPVALRVAGGFLKQRRSKPAAEYLRELAEQRLTRLGHEVTAVFTSSFEALNEPQQAALCALSVMPADFDRAAGVAVMQRDEGGGMRDELDELVALNLLEYNDETARLSWHDLLREFVETRCVASPNAAFLQAASLRHARHYTIVAKEADVLYKRGHEDVLHGLALFDRERAHIETAFATLIQPNPTAETQHALIDLVDAVVETSSLRFHPRQRIAWFQAESQAARAVEHKKAVSAALGNLGNVYVSLGEYRQAVEFHEQAMQISHEIGDRSTEGQDLGNLGLAYDHLGEYQRAIEFYELNVQIAREIGNRRSEGAALGNLGNAYYSLGEYLRAIEFHKQYLQISLEIGDWRGEANALSSLGNANHNLGETQKALNYRLQSLPIRQAIGDLYGEGIDCNNLSESYETLGDLKTALAYAERALAIGKQIESPRVSARLQQVDNLRQKLTGSA